MLQWMGGSRRKVTDSRKSTQKRQQQYFEQRRRQQQQPTFTEGNTSGVNVGQQHQKEQGSLDVLSFLNLSSISENTKSSHPKVGNGSQHTKCRTRTGLQSSVTNAFSRYAAESDETTVPLPGHQDTILRAEKDSFCSSNNNVSSKINSKPDLLNVASEGLSVFDLLVDDDGDENLQGSSVHESHVAFSVEGLGTVAAQTPPQSPMQHFRTSHSHCFPFRMTARKLGCSNNDYYFIDSTEPQVDEVIEDMILPLGGSFSDFLPAVLDSHENERQKPSFFADSLERDIYNCALKSSFGGTNNIFSYNWENSWEDTPGFVEDFVDERDDDSLKTCTHKLRGGYSQFSKAGDNMRPGYMVRGANPLKRRVYEISRFSTPDFSPPQNQKADFNRDFSSEEESCSSSAVWGGQSNSRDPDITSRKTGRTCDIFGSTWSKQSPVDIFAKVNRKQRDGLWRSHIPGPGMCMGKSISPDLTPPKHISCPFKDKTEMSENLLFGGSHSIKGKFDFGSFTHASNTDFPFLYSKSQKVEPVAAFPAPDRHVDVNSTFNQEKSVFSQPFDCLRHEKSPVFPNVDCETTGEFCLDPAEEMPSPLDVASAHWISELPALCAQGSARRDEGNKSKHQSSKFKLQGRTSGSSQKVPSTKKKWGEESNGRDPDITSRKSGRTCDIFGSTLSKQSPVDIFSKEVNHKQRDGLWRSHIPGPEMCMGKSISADLTPPKHISYPFEDKKEISENLLFGGSRSIKGNFDFDFGSFTHTSNTDFPSLYSKSQKVEPIAAFSAPDQHVDVKAAFSQPFDCLRYEKSPVFSNVCCETTDDFCLESAEEMPSPLDVASAHWNSEHPALSAQESASRDEGNKSKHQSSKFELQDRTSDTSQKVSSTRDQMERASLSPKITGAGLEKDTTKTPNLQLEGKTAAIAKHDDETASLVKIHEKSESTVDQSGTSHASEASLPCTTGSTENARSGEARLTRKNQGDALSVSSEQIMDA